MKELHTDAPPPFLTETCFDGLGGIGSVTLAVVAHPDDESFGLGAILAALTSRGTTVRVLCFSHGEASSLGFSDHRAATAAALDVAARRGLPVLEWGIPPDVATLLNNEFDTEFTGFDAVDIRVDRRAQWRAIRRHATQVSDNPVLRRRLELLGGSERVGFVPVSGLPPTSRNDVTFDPT